MRAIATYRPGQAGHLSVTRMCNKGGADQNAIGLNHEESHKARHKLSGKLHMPRKDRRNRDILVAYLSGAPKALLAAQYRLTLASVSGILTAERHKLDVSPQAEYQRLRELTGFRRTGSET